MLLDFFPRKDHYLGKLPYLMIWIQKWILVLNCSLFERTCFHGIPVRRLRKVSLILRNVFRYDFWLALSKSLCSLHNPSGHHSRSDDEYWQLLKIVGRKKRNQFSSLNRLWNRRCMTLLFFHLPTFISATKYGPDLFWIGLWCHDSLSSSLAKGWMMTTT